MYLINLFKLNIIPIPHKVEEDVIFTGGKKALTNLIQRKTCYLNSRHSALKMEEMEPVQYKCMRI